LVDDLPHPDRRHGINRHLLPSSSCLIVTSMDWPLTSAVYVQVPVGLGLSSARAVQGTDSTQITIPTRFIAEPRTMKGNPWTR
jgi:hypothetical protein